MAGADRQQVDVNVVGGRVVTPSGVRRAGIAIAGGRIAGVMAEELLPPAREVIDVRGRHILPGIVDPEAHPGHHKPWILDVTTETRAAAVGGVTTWGVHNPSPRFGQEPFKELCEPDDAVSFLEVFPRGRDIWNANAMVDMFYCFQLETDQQAGEIPRYAHELGVTSFKFYCHCRRLEVDRWWVPQRIGLVRGFDDGTFFLACQKAAEVGPPAVVMIHPENWEIARVLEQQLIAAGRTDMGAWDDRSPWFTEAHHIRAYGYLAKIAGSALYIQHCSNPLSIEEVVRARAEGVTVYAQTGPAWLYFTRDDWRINVPLRSREAIEAVWVALRDGVIDCVGSDHVPGRGNRLEMAAEGVWSTKKSGFPSRVEMLLPVMLHEGVNKGRISLERLVEVCCANPARIHGLYPQKGAILPGSDADLVVVDLDREETVRDDMIHCRAGWSLLTGHTIKGWPVLTMLRGKVIARWPDGAPRAEITSAPCGQHLPRRPVRTQA